MKTFIFLLVVAVFVAVSYVFLQSQIIFMSYRIKELTQRKEELLDRKQFYLARLFKMTSPQHLYGNLQNLGVEVGFVSPNKVVVLLPSVENTSKQTVLGLLFGMPQASADVID